MNRTKLERARRLVRSVTDLRPYLHVFRLLHYYNYTHVAERRLVDMGPGVQFAPNVSITNGERVSIGEGSHVGANCHLWAGNRAGRIIIGRYALFGPEVFLTASDYAFELGARVMDQPTVERDVSIGDHVWLGARVMVVAGVDIGEGCIVGAGAVVTKSLPPWSIAAGVPARVVGRRTLGVAPSSP